MKEIKEETKREVTDIHIYYEAIDGTRFKDIEECSKYEETALCIAKSKVRELIVTKEHNAWDVMGGYEDNSIFGVKVNSKEDADAIKQLILLDATYLQKDEYQERREKLFAKIDSAIGDIFIVGINCEGEWYAVNSRQNIINNLQNLDKEKPKDA